MALQFRGAHLCTKYLAWGAVGQRGACGRKGGGGGGRGKGPARDPSTLLLCLQTHSCSFISLQAPPASRPAFPAQAGPGHWGPRMRCLPAGAKRATPLPFAPTAPENGPPRNPAFTANISRDVQRAHICQTLFRRKKEKVFYLLFSQCSPRRCGLSRKRKRGTELRSAWPPHGWLRAAPRSPRGRAGAPLPAPHRCSRGSHFTQQAKTEGERTLGLPPRFADSFPLGCGIVLGAFSPSLGPKRRVPHLLFPSTGFELTFSWGLSGLLTVVFHPQMGHSSGLSPPPGVTT